MTRPDAKPRYATPRSPGLASEGEQVAIIARALGTPLIPWQAQVADVGGEVRPDGEYEHQVVVVTVPRQTGKTTLLRAVGVQSALVNRRDVFYTAQTGKDARERWMDLVKILRTSPLFASRVSVGLRGGSEQVTFPGGAAFRVFAPTVESLHGYTPPRVFLDEAFALDGPAGDLLMGAIGPAQLTITDRQLWIVSTAGTAASTFLHDWVDRAREAPPRVALFDWGARDDQDPYNPDHIAAFHPGVGHRLNGRILTPADVLDQAERNSRAEYERAYANRRTLTSSHLVAAEDLAPLLVDDMPTPAGPVVLAYDVAADRQSAAIVAGWVQDGRPTVRPVRLGPGYRWVADAVAELRQGLRPSAVVAAGHGPVLDVNRHVPDVQVLTERDYATASGWMLSAIGDQVFRYGGPTDAAAALAASICGLVTRPAVSDGVAFSRRNSVGDPSPAIAAALAGWWAIRPQSSGVIDRHSAA